MPESVCLSFCLSKDGIVLKQLNDMSSFLARRFRVLYRNFGTSKNKDTSVLQPNLVTNARY